MPVVLNNECSATGAESVPAASAGQQPVEITHRISDRVSNYKYNAVWSQALEGIGTTPTVLTLASLTYPNYTITRDLGTGQFIALWVIQNTGTEPLQVDFKTAGDIAIPRASFQIAPPVANKTSTMYMHAPGQNLYNQAIVTIDLAASANTTNCQILLASILNA